MASWPTGSLGPGALVVVTSSWSGSLEAFAVGGLKADAPIEAKTAAVIPAEHVLGVMGFQEAVAGEVSEHPFSHGVLEAL